MKKLFLSAALAALAGTPVLAGVSGHGDGHGAHGSHGEQMAANWDLDGHKWQERWWFEG